MSFFFVIKKNPNLIYFFTSTSPRIFEKGREIFEKQDIRRFIEMKGRGVGCDDTAGV